MSLIETLARMEAAAAGAARPLTTVRHRHLSDRPLVCVPLTTAGEAGAPLGALVGTDRERPLLLTVAQPRDRDLRFAFLAELADAVLPYLDGFADTVGHEERKETDPESGKKVTVQAELCADAPQLIVPSTAGVAYMRLLGRSTRFRRTAEQDPEAPYPAPPHVPLLGRWLTHLGERARVPGSCLLLSMTELLTRHWATGQSALEDQHLGALLAWIDPPEGLSGRAAAERAESARGEDGMLHCPPAGPATDPAFDNALLAPAMARYDADVPGAAEELRELIGGQLRPTWDAVWRGYDLLRALPPGAHVVDRWKRDRWSYTAHRDRVRAGEPPQPKRDDAVTAARKLASRETAQAQLDAQEALDDPLVMAGRRLAGEAFAGEVTAVEESFSEGPRPMPRPLVTLRTADTPLLTDGARLHRPLPDGKAQSAVFVAYEDGAAGSLTVRLTGGMGRGKVPAPGSVPEPGETVCWTLFEHAPRGGPQLPEPEDTPWTHGGPPAAGPEGDAPDPMTPEDFL
ncbi:hypothetical protein [Streptomyces benahoarensis]|uniref:Uncharacterized protein n=1 Tax=Streptomyces benahoarensis TaxID=2595054 RepID=A0A553YQE1_9ACTN|nr:hypothetical protein [Streptomyces benahoarensis]TSB25661.1 hypothetical protein FNJ62_12445 [Streptomyces benahoarensis]TSB31438.1 hypothetical protein FNZ23_25815 [Streptomyces benahoarensis]